MCVRRRSTGAGGSSLPQECGNETREKEKGKYGEQYRLIAADYETLAKEMRDAATAMQADLTRLREKVESIEAMMREVG